MNVKSAYSNTKNSDDHVENMTVLGENIPIGWSGLAGLFPESPTGF